MALRDAKLCTVLGLTCLLVLSGAGCGGDDDSGNNNKDGGAGSSGMDGGGGSSGTGASGTGSSGSGGKSGSGGSSGSSGSSGGGTGGTGMMSVQCDSAIPTTASCGGTACSVDGMFPTLVCAVPCCLPDNTCGTRRAYATDPTDCAPPATPDTSCPDYETGMGGTFAGCCAPSGRCGVISSADNSCITSSPILTDLAPGDPCGDLDGGTENDGG